MKKCSVITAVYNSNKTLSRCLLALGGQTERDFELIICDDGSSEDCLPIINEYQKYFQNKIKYVRHERNGIRKTMTLNRGVLAAETDYLLFIDPDCLADEDWVKVHLEEREKGCYLIGRRVGYREQMAPYITAEFITSNKYSKINLFNIYHAMAGHIKYIEQFLKIKNTLLRKILHHKKSTYLMGCNFSCWKEDMVKVNGWDNDFHGLGREDVELDGRLKRSGVKPKSVKFLTGVFHIYHAQRKNDEWKDYYDKAAGNPGFEAKNGLRELI